MFLNKLIIVTMSSMYLTLFSYTVQASHTNIIDLTNNDEEPVQKPSMTSVQNTNVIHDDGYKILENQISRIGDICKKIHVITQKCNEDYTYISKDNNNSLIQYITELKQILNDVEKTDPCLLRKMLSSVAVESEPKSKEELSVKTPSNRLDKTAADSITSNQTYGLSQMTNQPLMKRSSTITENNKIPLEQSTQNKSSKKSKISIRKSKKFVKDKKLKEITNCTVTFQTSMQNVVDESSIPEVLEPPVMSFADNFCSSTFYKKSPIPTKVDLAQSNQMNPQTYVFQPTELYKNNNYFMPINFTQGQSIQSLFSNK